MEKTLLIMAAGMGSRFGGLKQLTPIGPSGEFIIDYSIYDAIKAGFTKVIFIIKEENYDTFKETIATRIEPYIKVEYCFQNNNLVPEKYLEVLKDRTKPLGTAHAILCAKDLINEPFAVINADDFYGSNAFYEASKLLDNLKQTKPYQYAMICYKLKNTITEKGSLTRGICEVENEYLKNITECFIEHDENKLEATKLDTKESYKIDDNTEVSMNLLLFSPSIFPYMEEQFYKFLEENKDDLSKCEFFIPTVIIASIKENYAQVIVKKTNAKWYGITNKEDADMVKSSISNLVKHNEYPNNLWK